MFILLPLLLSLGIRRLHMKYLIEVSLKIYSLTNAFDKKKRFIYVCVKFRHYIIKSL